MSLNDVGRPWLCCGHRKRRKAGWDLCLDGEGRHGGDQRAILHDHL